MRSLIFYAAINCAIFTHLQYAQQIHNRQLKQVDVIRHNVAYTQWSVITWTGGGYGGRAGGG